MWNGSGNQPNTKTKDGFERFLDDCVALAGRAGKELYASETVWGARDDATPRRGDALHPRRAAQRGIGYIVHALHHSLVADLHQDAWGPVGTPEWLHFVEADGSLRAGPRGVRRVRPAPGPLTRDLLTR